MTKPPTLKPPTPVEIPGLREGLIAFSTPTLAAPVTIRCVECRCTVGRSHVPGGVRCVEGAAERERSIREW